MTDKIAELNAENERLKSDLEIARLRVRDTAQDRILDTAYANAKKILHMRFAGYSPTRRWLAEAEIMSEWRYGWAYGLLKYAGLNEIEPISIEGLDACIERLNGVTHYLRTKGSPNLLELRAKAGKRYTPRRYR